MHSLLLAVAHAERVDGGWEISGHKIFGSLSPVWTFGGFHAADVSDPEHPQIVHGFLPRGTSGYQIIDTWVRKMAPSSPLGRMLTGSGTT